MQAVLTLLNQAPKSMPKNRQKACFTSQVKKQLSDNLLKCLLLLDMELTLFYRSYYLPSL